MGHEGLEQFVPGIGTHAEKDIKMYSTGKINPFFNSPIAYLRISVTDSLIGLVVLLCDSNNCSCSTWREWRA